MKVIKAKVLIFLTLTIIWLLLTFPLDWQEIAVGSCIALLIGLLPFPGSILFAEIRLNPKALLFIFLYLAVFFVELVKSNLDVAFRVLHPVIPINPGIVKVKTRLKSKTGRLLLANSITLTPGTITVESKDEYLYIHWINVHGKDIDEMTGEIVSKFERYLEVIFG